MVFVGIGAPYSYGSVIVQCTVGSPCTTSQSTGTEFVPMPVALVPLACATLTGIGVVARRFLLSWLGGTALLIFAIVSGFSVGLFYLPFTIAILAALVGLRFQSLSKTTDSPKLN